MRAFYNGLEEGEKRRRNAFPPKEGSHRRSYRPLLIVFSGEPSKKTRACSSAERKRMTVKIYAYE